MLELKAKPREELGKKVNKLRKNGQIPAVLYGHGVKSQAISVLAGEFAKVFQEAGESSLVALNLDGKKRNVLIHDVRKDPLGEKILHVDFYQVRMDEKIKATVPLIFIGESAAVKTEGGILVKNIQEVEIEALPQDLPHHLEVDISRLKSFDEHIFIKDLAAGGSLKILAEPEEIVASVIPPRSEEELAALEEKAEEKVEEVKVVGEEAPEPAEEIPTEEAEEKKEKEEEKKEEPSPKS